MKHTPFDCSNLARTKRAFRGQVFGTGSRRAAPLLNLEHKWEQVLEYLERARPALVREPEGTQDSRPTLSPSFTAASCVVGRRHVLPRRGNEIAGNQHYDADDCVARVVASFVKLLA
jgi:hypothetical protein